MSALKDVRSSCNSKGKTIIIGSHFDPIEISLSVFVTYSFLAFK